MWQKARDAFFSRRCERWQPPGEVALRIYIRQPARADERRNGRRSTAGIRVAMEEIVVEPDRGRTDVGLGGVDVDVAEAGARIARQCVPAIEFIGRRLAELAFRERPSYLDEAIA